MSAKKSDADHVAIKDLPPVMEKLRGLHEVLSEEEISKFLSESYPDMNQSIEFEPFLRVRWILPSIDSQFTYKIISLNVTILQLVRST